MKICPLIQRSENYVVGVANQFQFRFNVRFQHAIISFSGLDRFQTRRSMVSLEYPDIGVQFGLPEGSQSTGKEGTNASCAGAPFRFAVVYQLLIWLIHNNVPAVLLTMSLP